MSVPSSFFGKAAIAMTATVVIASPPAWAGSRQQQAGNDPAAAPQPLAPSDDPPAPDPPPEIGRTIFQVATGALVAFAGAGAALSGANDDEALTFGALLLTPAAVGGLVGVVGNGGASESSFGWTILGAYAGAATVVPIGWVMNRRTAALDGHRGGSGFAEDDLVLALLVGWLVIQPLAATAAWHLWKRPKAQLRARLAPPRTNAARRPDRDPTLHTRSPAPSGAFVAPVVGASF